MIKVFHEAPKSIFKNVQKWTDGDYALVHLMDKDPEYERLFRDSVESGREVILDNSLFELGASFDPSVFAEWVEKLRPTYYVIPDVLEDGQDSVALGKKFLSDFRGLPGKTMGVVHGKDYEDFKECYREMIEICDKVCISLDNPWWHSQLVDGENVYNSLGELTEEANRRWCNEAAIGRAGTIWRLRDEGVLNVHKPHHLLGCYLPQEMNLYRTRNFCLDSIDTSNPVLHGLAGISYPAEGPAMKISTKMETMMNEPVSSQQLATIKHNVDLFRAYCS